MKENIREKVVSILITGMLAAMLTACGQEKLPTAEFEQNEMEYTEAGQTEKVEKTEAAQTESQQPEALEPKQNESGQTVTDEQEASDLTETPVTDLSWNMAVSAEPFRIANPSLEYYLSDKVKAESAMESPAVPLTLVCTSERTNQIIDTEEWFSENGLAMPAYDDELYTYEVERENYSSGYLLHIRDKKAPGTIMATLDFSDYRYAGEFVEADEAFIEQYIHHVARNGYALYISIGHNTYAKSAPHNAYIVAVDLRDMSVLWKTEPLVSNAFNFEVIGDILVCGYGFTAEDDYLKQIDIHTGKVLEETALKSMADYIIRKGSELYVRTYNTDYVFELPE